MTKFISPLFKLFLFWIFFFFFQRIIFFAYEQQFFSDADFYSLLLSNGYALRYDISAASYFLIVSVLLLFLQGLGFQKYFRKAIIIYQTLVIILSSFIHVVDLEIYKAWGTKLNGKAISYLVYPQEVFASVSLMTIFILLILFLTQAVLGFVVFKKYFVREEKFCSQKKYKVVLLTLCSLFFLFIGIRGGIQQTPLNKGYAYFSKYPVVNHASINGDWNLFYELTHSATQNNPYNYFSKDVAKNSVVQIYKTNNSPTEKILTTDTPNIVLIMLESWSADVIAALSDEKGITPEFEILSKEGLLFTNFYASGFRTEQGLLALLSGFPAQPRTSMIRDFGKFEKLPSMTKVLSSNYYSSVYYGGNLDFANMSSYLRTVGFKKIIGENDFTYTHKTAWGAYDDELLSFQAGDLKNSPQPFFSLLMTITSHEPFDAPIEKVFDEKDVAPNYKNTVHYTDKSLGSYFEKAKKEAWYHNTLFILVADHGHIYPKGRTYNEPLRYKIPLLFYGDVIKKEYRGKTVSKFGSQTDIAATILNQLNSNNQAFHWSKDLLNQETPSFAFYTFEDGFGWVSDEEFFVFDNAIQKIVLQKTNLNEVQNTEMINQGKAYLQSLYQEYLHY